MGSEEYATSKHVPEVRSETPSGKIRVKLKFFTTLRELTKKREEEFKVPEQAVIKDVLALVSLRYGQQVYDYLHEKGKLRPQFQILIDGKNVSQDRGLETPVYENCVIAILPPAGGG